MADSFVQLPVDSTGKKIDTRTENINSEHRQVFVIGDPVANTGVAPVDATLGMQVQANQVGTWTVGAHNVSLPGNTSVLPAAGATMTVYQGTNPWLANASIVGSITAGGTQAAGVTLSMGLSPVIIAGEDYAANPKIQIPKIDAAGAMFANVSIPAAITANQGGAPWLANASIQGIPAVSQSGTWSVTASLAAPATVTLSGAVSINAANVSLVGISPVSQSGSWSVTASLAAPATVTLSGAISANVSLVGISPVSQSGTWSVTASLAAPATVTLGAVNLSPTTGGWTPYATSALTSTVTISAVAGKFGGYFLANLNSAPAYVQVFDTTANVTLGFTAPNLILPIPANATPANALAANLELANGVNIANGIKVAATTQATGSSLVATGLVGSVWYK